MAEATDPRLLVLYSRVWSQVLEDASHKALANVELAAWALIWNPVKDGLQTRVATQEAKKNG